MKGVSSILTSDFFLSLPDVRRGKASAREQAKCIVQPSGLTRALMLLYRDQEKKKAQAARVPKKRSLNPPGSPRNGWPRL